MAGQVKTFDPKQVTAIFGGKIISGWAENTFIEVERSEKAFNLKVGVDGEGARSKSNNKSGTIKFTLMQTSQSNDDLSSIAAADEISNSGALPFYLKDNSPGGRTLCTALTAWVQKYPKVGMAREVQEREWILETDDLEMFVGGN